MPYEYMGVAEFASITGRHRRTVLCMISSGVLGDAGYQVERIRSKRGGRKTGKWAIGVPVQYNYTCPDCGKKWEDQQTTPDECPGCRSKRIERTTKVA